MRPGGGTAVGERMEDYELEVICGVEKAIDLRFVFARMTFEFTVTVCLSLPKLVSIFGFIKT